jgi:hypothetical protein
LLRSVAKWQDHEVCKKEEFQFRLEFRIPE